MKALATTTTTPAAAEHLACIVKSPEDLRGRIVTYRPRESTADLPFRKFYILGVGPICKGPNGKYVIAQVFDFDDNMQEKFRSLLLHRMEFFRH